MMQLVETDELITRTHDFRSDFNTISFFAANFLFGKISNIQSVVKLRLLKFK